MKTVIEKVFEESQRASNRIRIEAFDKFPDSPSQQVYYEAMERAGMLEAALIQFAAKSSECLERMQTKEEKTTLINSYLENNYENYMLHDRTLWVSNLMYHLQDNVADDIELIQSLIFAFCYKKSFSMQF